MPRNRNNGAQDGAIFIPFRVVQWGAKGDETNTCLSHLAVDSAPWTLHLGSAVAWPGMWMWIAWEGRAASGTHQHGKLSRTGSLPHRVQHVGRTSECQWVDKRHCTPPTSLAPTA